MSLSTFSDSLCIYTLFNNTWMLQKDYIQKLIDLKIFYKKIINEKLITITKFCFKKRLSKSYAFFFIDWNFQSSIYKLKIYLLLMGDKIIFNDNNWS